MLYRLSFFFDGYKEEVDGEAAYLIHIARNQSCRIWPLARRALVEPGPTEHPVTNDLPPLHIQMEEYFATLRIMNEMIRESTRQG